jgi:hypothetical protein
MLDVHEHLEPMEAGDTCRVLIHKFNGDRTKHLQEEMLAGILRLRKIKARKRNPLRTRKTKKNANHSEFVRP